MPAIPVEPAAAHITRRRLLTGAGAFGALGLLTACGGGTGPTAAPSAPGTAGFPITVEHRNGTTQIPAPPQRVVTVGYSDQDPVLALGVRPVGVTDWYGDHPYATWPWAQDELGDAKPSVMNRGTFTGTPEYQYEEIAALAPDLIIGLYTSMDATQYETLSRIAPTVGPPAGFAEWGAPWQENTRLAGRALGRRHSGRAGPQSAPRSPSRCHRAGRPLHRTGPRAGAGPVGCGPVARSHGRRRPGRPRPGPRHEQGSPPRTRPPGRESSAAP
ncbi:MAG TPA: ABC transporter substrate-binding protein, partial [Pseudonocardia sp.]